MDIDKQPIIKANHNKSTDYNYNAQASYVTAMLSIVGRSLVAASSIDKQVQESVRQLPTGLIIAMTVFGTLIGLVLEVVQVDENTPKHLQLVSKTLVDGKLPMIGKPVLRICFKHISHAYAVLSFQESTATAFAYDRITVDGDVGFAVVMVHCLNRLESVILPKVLARRAIKAYPNNLSLLQKLELALKIYSKLAASYLTGFERAS